jgi:hypothetical protein
MGDLLSDIIRMLDDFKPDPNMWTGRIVENVCLVVEDGIDWSRCRSPARAMRRAASISRRGRPKRAHPQRCRTKWKPCDPVIIGGVLHCHPSTAAALRAAISPPLLMAWGWKGWAGSH